MAYTIELGHRMAVGIAWPCITYAPDAIPQYCRKEQTMSPEQDKQSGGISRRKFLRALGMGVVVSGTARVLPGRAAHAQQPQQRRFVIPVDRFGRLFPQLRPFAPPSLELKAALLELGQPGGILVAKDDLAAGPVNLIADPALSRNNPNSTAHTAGTTFMGQFMDHDMTFDLTSRLGEPTAPEGSINTRTPAFDLDSVYGGGQAKIVSSMSWSGATHPSSGSRAAA